MDLSDIPAVDGHCHPLLADPGAVSPERFASLFSEGRPGTMAAHIPHTGYFRRALRDLAERLGTEATIEAVLERRRQLGAEAAPGVFTDSGVAALLVDTGYPPDAMPLGRMRSILQCPIHEVFRIETCAQALLPRALPYAEFLDALREELRAASGLAVAYRLPA